MANASLHSASASGTARPTSIVRGIPAEEKTFDHPVYPTTTTPTELPTHYAPTQPIEAAAHQTRTTSTPYGESYTQETRKISSVVVESTPLVDVQQDNVRYVEIPTVEEQVRHVIRKEVREVEKIVTRPEIEYVERVVVVPKIEYVDKTVEIPQVHYVDKHVKVPQVQTFEKEVVVEKKVQVPRIREQTREVPGPIVEVPKPYPVEKRVEKFTETKQEVPVIVAQTIRPIITESNSQLVVDAYHYEPEIVPVDVHLARPVHTSLEVVGRVDERHKVVTVTAAQYNAILRSLNAGADERVYKTLPFISEHGSIPFCAEQEAKYIVAPEHLRIEGWTRPVTNWTTKSREGELDAVVSMHSTAIPAATRCCGPRATTTATSTPVAEPMIRGTSIPQEQPVEVVPVHSSVTAASHHQSVQQQSLQQQSMQQQSLQQQSLVQTQSIQQQPSVQPVVTTEQPIVYDIPASQAHRSAAGGSIRSQPQVVVSQMGTLPPQQRSRVCC
eukprot:Protomagalhaensia_wolfi_Nauph_80__4306@NODE_439_length_2516_cov_511_255955_g331_i0_p1_GENE_NODE_439_length_2516_cov_511_255955_g331_i0NODE_439_length_2516_cov_511_255955_g331_i0_p1_ORF_typecomplete_len534_score151_31IMCp/PF12314_8/15IMCp/PF12314_8/7e09IMCp/PF12314_8/7_7e03IMCp/PF12314_8/1_8e04IMCp/PF12314_8/6_8e03Activator_LAG3/PF11498_8/1_1e03_NODE_439_length_2516_cov_511_255955_g331_i01081604